MLNKKLMKILSIFIIIFLWISVWSLFDLVVRKYLTNEDHQIYLYLGMTVVFSTIVIVYLVATNDDTSSLF